MGGAATEQEKDELQRFCRRLGDVRVARGMSQRQVDTSTDRTITHGALSRIEHCQRTPNLRSVQALCKAYDMDVIVKRDGTIRIQGTGLGGV